MHTTRDIALAIPSVCPFVGRSNTDKQIIEIFIQNYM